MLHLATRPLGYAVVGGLALVLGLGSGAVIGYFLKDDAKSEKVEPQKHAVVVIGKKPEDIAIPIPPAPKIAEDEAAENSETVPVPPSSTVSELPAREPGDALAYAAPESVGVNERDFGEQIDLEAEAWERHAVTVPDPAGKPMIAIVIDDLGMNRRNTVRAIRLPGPLTMAFLTYAEDLEQQTDAARAAGHELMVHFPMEPKDHHFDTGPNALTNDLDDDEIRRRLRWGLERFEGYVGFNNHMGSAFTSNERGMAIVMEEVRRRGLLYIDSLTTSRSMAAGLAAQNGVPFAARDIFIDNHIAPEEIAKQLAKVETVARRKGYAIAIGHPHTNTIKAVEAWLPKLEEAGFALVPVSTVIKHRRSM